MQEGYQLQVLERAREISAAVFRVCVLIRHTKLRMEIEGAAVDLVSQCGEIPYLSYMPQGVKLPYLPYIEKLKNLIQLGEMVGEIKPINVRVLERELGALHSAIADSLAYNKEVDLRDAFVDENGFGARLTTRKSVAESVLVRRLARQSFSVGGSFSEGGKEAGFDGKTRQSAILDYIRQLPNGCRMRDLVAKFPEVSERTLRNDLQGLVASSLVEKVGIQGPTSFFRGVTKGEVIAL